MTDRQLKLTVGPLRCQILDRIFKSEFLTSDSSCNERSDF